MSKSITPQQVVISDEKHILGMQIVCEEKHCGSCQHWGNPYGHQQCTLFDVRLTEDKERYKTTTSLSHLCFRHSLCLEAEKLIKESPDAK